MSIENATFRRDDLLQTIGKSALNLAFPDEFELYVLAFELLNQKGETLSYFIFPTNPSTLDESQPEITNIKKTLGGVVSLSSPSFIPPDITLTGNFGRRFRVLLGQDYTELLGGFSNGPVEGVKQLFSNKIKTGYGCIKVLESLVRDSKKIDSENGVKTLIFHNLALGNSYVVKPLGLRFTQSQESNMIWNYNLTLKGIAPLKALYTDSELTSARSKLIITGYLQTQANRAVNELSSSLERARVKNNI